MVSTHKGGADGTQSDCRFPDPVFTLPRLDAVLEAALLVCIVGLARRRGGVHKLLFGRQVVQTQAHPGAEGDTEDTRDESVATDSFTTNESRM